MKRVLFSALLFGATLQAMQLNPSQPGSAASSGTQAATNSQWQNWTFAATMLATAVAGVIAASAATGNTAH